MGEKKTVYAVVTGEYSDREIQALFEDMADAEVTAERIQGHVEAFDHYPTGSGQVIRSRHRVTSRSFVDLSGNVLDYTETWSTAVDADEEPPRTKVRRVNYTSSDIQLFEIVRRCDDDGNIIEERKPLDKPRANFIYAGGYEVVASADDEGAARALARGRADGVAAVINSGGTQIVEP